MWKNPFNPVAGVLYFQVHPCAARKLLIGPLLGASRAKARSTPMAYISRTPSKFVICCTRCSELLSRRECVFFFSFLVLPDDNTRAAAHSWCTQKEKEFVLFHNHDMLYTVVGAFKSDQVRAFHQWNLSATDEPAGSTPEDVRQRV